jgi:general secretion pathway protein G
MRVARQHRTIHGFTLLEVIVVITIIALLASLITPRLLGNVDRAKAATARAEVNIIAQQVSLFCLAHDQTAPSEDFELGMLTEGDQATLKKSQLADPWANDYLLFVPGPIDPEFNVASYAADGQPGGAGYAADIYNE